MKAAGRAGIASLQKEEGGAKEVMCLHRPPLQGLKAATFSGGWPGTSPTQGTSELLPQVTEFPRATAPQGCCPKKSPKKAPHSDSFPSSAPAE